MTLKKEYEKVLEESEGTDPDFPMFSFGSAGKKIAGTNIHTLTKQVEEEDEEENIYSSSVDNARNSTVEERALNFLRNVGLKQ